MATTIAEASTAATAPQAPARAGEAAFMLVVGVLLLSSTLIIVGLLWDISWHLSIGRDTLWSPPHVLEQIGASLAGLACGLLVLRTTFGGSTAQQSRAVRFWGFRGPIGGWVAIWGAFAMIFSVPFDNWWHNAYGLDVQILSPPHVVLLLGMVAIQLGAMLLALSVQNRSSEARAKWLAIAFSFGAGAMIAMVGTTLSEYMLLPNRWHNSLTFRVAAMAFPLLLLAVARAGRLPYAATAAAGFYMLVYLVPQWIIVQFGATPRLTPILNPITHMSAFAFPLVLAAPAFALDLGLRRWDRFGDWKLAALLGPLFVVVMVAVHWPFGSFLVQSPLAQNDLFLGNHWGYGANIQAPWRSQFLGEDGTFGSVRFIPFLSGLPAAVVFAIVSARLGLLWGRWLRGVRR
ncbi:MAG: hypothetical protein ACREMQ_03085 [Longimicrobiales bacterium]